MKFPKWAPPELIEKHVELKPRAEAERKRHKEFMAQNHPEVDWHTYLESERHLFWDRAFIGDIAQFEILEAMITTPVMEDVWRNVLKRPYQHRSSLFGGKTQALNLYGAVVNAEMMWLNTPKLTRTEARKVHEEIAAVALQLSGMLVNCTHSRLLLDTATYIDKEKHKHFMEALEKDGHDLWYGFDGYLEHLLDDLVPAVPRILLELHKRALEYAAVPYAVNQPNSPRAKLNFYIHEISQYFMSAYGQPLHAHVAAIVSAIFNEDVDEDRVRALLRSRKTAARKRTRKRSREQKGNSAR